jgi:hypothetical protein
MHGQLRNHLQTTIDVYVRRESAFRLYWRLPAGTPTECLFTEQDTQSKAKHSVVALARSMAARTVVPIEICGRAVKVFLVFAADAATATKFVTLIAPCVGISLFPVPLTASVEGAHHTLRQGEPADLLALPPGAARARASFSLDIDHVPVADKVALSFKKITSSPLYDPILGRVLRLAILCEQDDATEQVTLTFFVPVVFFNLTPRPLLIAECAGRQRLRVNVLPGTFACWCPDSYIDDNDALKVDVSVADQTEVSGGFNCANSATGKLFLKMTDVDSLCIGIKFDVSLKSRIACVTFAPLVVVRNLLPGTVLLQAILAIPKVSDSAGLATLAEPVGSPMVIERGEGCAMSGMTECCGFVMTFQSVPSTPVLGFDRAQRTVFKIIAADGILLVELEVVDVGTQFRACLRAAPFPTPLLIANCLPAQLTAYHTLPQSPFTVPPFTTSRFALDEPLAYPSVHLLFDDAHLHVSLIEDTDFIRTSAACAGDLVFVSIKQLSADCRAVYVTCAVPSPLPLFSFEFTAQLAHATVSFIDLQTREFALLSLSGLTASLERVTGGVFFVAAVESLQLDHQSPEARHPVVLAGRSYRGFPFARLQLVLPADAPLFSQPQCSKMRSSDGRSPWMSQTTTNSPASGRRGGSCARTSAALAMSGIMSGTVAAPICSFSASWQRIAQAMSGAAAVVLGIEVNRWHSKVESRSARCALKSRPDDQRGIPLFKNKRAWLITVWQGDQIFIEW